MKKLISMMGTLVLCVCMLCATVTAALAAEEDSYALTRGNLCMLLVEAMDLADADVGELDNPFTDVSPEDEYYEAVLICVERGIISGVGGARFQPNGAIMREQFAVVLWNLAGKPSSGKADLSAYGGGYSAWAEDGLSWAIGNGVMWADDDGSLRATEVAYSDDADISLALELKTYALTRGSLAMILTDKLELSDYDASKLDNPFTDLSPEDEYYEAILVCKELGIMSGYDATTFGPKNTVSRASVAQIFYNQAGRPEVTVNPSDYPDVNEGHWYVNAVCWCLDNGIMATDEQGYVNPNRKAYFDEFDFSKLAPIEEPGNTVVQMDISKGNISIAVNTFFSAVTQNDETVRTTGGIIVRQSGSTTSNNITVSGGEVEMTLAGVNISFSDASPISVSSGAHLVLNLLGDNALTATGSGCAGIEVPAGAELIIKGTGTLTATGGNYAAGIGGGRNGDGGIIDISGGTVNATGGEQGAGIGGGKYGDGGTITISGGTVTATGGGGGAGIGSGIEGNRYGDGGTITITGGVVVATGDGSGIGGWKRSGDITINGGTVIAVGGGGSPGIGSTTGKNDTITITGGKVTATGGEYSAGIGGGYGLGYDAGVGGTIIISGGTVTASGYYHAIGGGYLENQYGCDSIIITNATLDLSHTHYNGALYQERIFDLELTDTMAALPGSMLTMTTVARGASGLAYQWQSSADRSSWTDVVGQTSATLAVPMTAEMDKINFRCKLTNGFGNVVYTDVAQSFVLAFEKQPTPVEVNVGDYAALEAKSTCDNVSYHWERSYDNGLSWNTVPGEIYSSLLVDATLSENGALYRCVITGTNGDQLASDAVPITVNTDDVTYTVKYYHQLPDGSGYGVAEQAVLVGTPNGSVTALEKTFEGFVENTAKGEHSGTVASDGSLVLSRYYDRKEYSITFDMQGGGALPAITARYEAPVSAPADPVRYGYDFGGWYADKALTTPYTFGTMPLNGATVFAKWVNLDEGRGIEYQINSILFRDAGSYEALDSIPDGDFMVEASVTNLSSTHMDTVLFVSYDKDGRMLGFHYAFANPTIGQTMAFGTAIDNEDGQVAKVKVMVLSNLAGATPLAKAASGF